jgi:hypothetical protein
MLSAAFAAGLAVQRKFKDDPDTNAFADAILTAVSVPFIIAKGLIVKATTKPKPAEPAAIPEDTNPNNGFRPTPTPVLNS